MTAFTCIRFFPRRTPGACFAPIPEGRGSVVLKLVRERTFIKSERISKPDQVNFGLTDERINNYRVTITTHTALNDPE
jgi:hypothetical protein